MYVEEIQDFIRQLFCCVINRCIKEFLSDLIVSVADVNNETAENFGELKSVLKKQGTPIPLNDIWIAAQCVELGAVLVTFDRHFSQIPGLRIWS